MRFDDDFARFPVGPVQGYTTDITNAWNRPRPWGQWDIAEVGGRNWLRFAAFRDTTRGYCVANKSRFTTGTLQTMFVLANPNAFQNLQVSLLARHIPNIGANYFVPRDGIELKLRRFNEDNKLILSVVRGGLNVSYIQTPLVLDFGLAYHMILQVTETAVLGEILEGKKSLALLSLPLTQQWQGQVGFASDADGFPNDPAETIFAGLSVSPWEVRPLGGGWDTRPGVGGRIERYMRGVQDSDGFKYLVHGSRYVNAYTTETLGMYLDDQRRIYV